MAKKYYAKEETLERVKQLQGERLVNKDGQEANIYSIMRFAPIDTDLKEGDAVSVITNGKEREEFLYWGEEGFQKMLKDWEVLDGKNKSSK